MSFPAKIIIPKDFHKKSFDQSFSEQVKWVFKQPTY